MMLVYVIWGMKYGFVYLKGVLVRGSEEVEVFLN